MGLRNESEWAYLPQSEERVVAQQLKNRSRLDAAYQARQQSGTSLDSEGSFGLAEAVLCTYMDLDRLIEACALPDNMMAMQKSVMDGYSLRDIAELDARELNAVEREFRNIVSMIVRRNNREWLESHARKNVPAWK